MHFYKKPVCCFVLFVCLSTTTAQAQWGKQTFTPPPTPVVAVKAKAVTWHKTLRAIGSLVASKSVTIKAGITGHIEKILFKSGQFVPKGQLIIMLDHDMLSAQLKEANAQAKLNQLTYSRAKRLVRTKSISQSELDQAEANFEVSKAKVQQIQASIDKKFIKAPFSGSLGLRHINVGDYVLSDQDLVYLQSSRPIYIDFTIPEPQKALLAQGQEITLKTSSYPKHAFKGTILAFDSKVDAQTRSITVRGTLPNQNKRLMPGGFAEVIVATKQSEQLISIPQEAVQKEMDGSYVYKVSQGKATRVTIAIASRTAGHVLIMKNPSIHANDEIITEGQLKLQDGSPVSIVKEVKHEM